MQKSKLKNIWKNISEAIFLAHHFPIKTKRNKEQILNRVEQLLSENEYDYKGTINADGFTIAEKRYKSFMVIGFTKNDFAPVAKAKIIEEDHITTVAVTLSSRQPVRILDLFLYITMFLYMFYNPMATVFVLLMTFMHYIALFLPARRLKEKLVALLPNDLQEV